LSNDRSVAVLISPTKIKLVSGSYRANAGE
jgi:hypothetical protein